VFEGTPEELVVVANASLKFACVDEVEGLAVQPFGFIVVNLEEAVWRSPNLRVSTCS
jgi:hypothetical protein